MYVHCAPSQPSYKPVGCGGSMETRGTSAVTGLLRGPLTPSALIPAHYGGVVGRWGIEEIVRREEERKEGGRRWGGEGEERR